MKALAAIRATNKSDREVFIFVVCSSSVGMMSWVMDR